MNTSKVTQKLHWDEALLAALKEDIPWEDVSANAVVPAASRGHADLIAKAEGVIAGLPVFARVFTLLDEGIQVVFHVEEGARVQKGTLVAEVTGDMRAILSGERTALNFLQRMSGIATYTRQMAELLQGGIPNVVVVQPFGCLPNHIIGKGMMKPMKEKNPGANIVAIDYDAGATKINQENRLKLMLANARERQKEEKTHESTASGTKKEEVLSVP